MVFHIDENRQGAAFVSVPETEYCGASAPAPLLDAQAIRTLYEVEQISGIRMDHLAILDWHSIGRLVDLVGGVDVELDPAPGDSGPTRVDVAAEQIVDFVGGDVASPPDEIARILRQQRLLDAVLQNALHQEFRKQPLQLHRALHLVSTGLAVDRTWSMTQMARLVISLRNLRSRAITYHTAFPDCDGATLWEQVRSDRLGG
ncbi:LCP family glycopolymer transferase [Rhodococcus aetherivorans]